MRRLGGNWAVGGLALALAVLLAAGGLAVTGGRPEPSTSIQAGGPVGAASVEFDGVAADPVVTSTTALPAGIAGPGVAPTTSSTRPTIVPTSVRQTTTTMARPRPTTTTTRPAAPLPTASTTTLPTVPVRSRWSGTTGPLSVSVRMDPPAPVAGQTVTFTITVAPGVSCCIAALMEFGDEADQSTDIGEHVVTVSQRCVNRSAVSGTRPHTYAEPWAYQAFVRVIAFECLPAPDENGVQTGAMMRVEIPMCVGVGPGQEAAVCAP